MSETMPATTVNVATITPLLEELRSVIDRREELATEDKGLAERKAEIERALLEYQKATGVEALKGGGMSVTFDADAMRAKYDPERWDAIIRWAVEQNQTHIIQRRMTDAKVIDLVNTGVALPDGLTLEPYVKLSTRRVNK